MTVYIYGLYDPRNGNLRYIGKTLDMKMRSSLHRSESRCGRNSHKNQWLRQLMELGLMPEMRVLETIENSNDLDWQERERWWIRAGRESGDPLTNLDAGGRGGNLKSEETKNKIKEKATGRKMSLESIAKMKATKAASMTPELRRRLSEINIGRKHSQEIRRARSNALMGRMVSEETRRKIGESNKRSREAYLAINIPKCRMPKVKKERKPISEETRQKMRLAKLGKKQTPEAIEASHAPLRGMKRSEETRRKMSAAKTAGWAAKKARQIEVYSVKI